MKREIPQEEEDFVGEMASKEPDPFAEGLTLEQRTRWLELVAAFQERLKEIDPRLTAKLDDDGILQLSRWPIDPAHRVPCIDILHPDLPKALCHVSTGAKDVDVEKITSGIEKLLAQVRKILVKKLKK